MKEEEIESMRRIFNNLKKKIEPLAESPKIQALQERVIDIRKDAIENNEELIAIAKERFKENDIDCFSAKGLNQAIWIRMRFSLPNQNPIHCVR